MKLKLLLTLTITIGQMGKNDLLAMWGYGGVGGWGEG